MSGEDRIARSLVRLLVEEHGAAVVVRWVEEASPDNAPRPPKKRRSISHAEAAKRARDLAPPDELARMRARRGK